MVFDKHCQQYLCCFCAKVNRTICTLLQSLPARGAWIEMVQQKAEGLSHMSLPARGAWIEMLALLPLEVSISSRSPRGERGLKSGSFSGTPLRNAVAPREGSVD